jgi:predicted metal-dependent phosphoesterase TrpH
MIDLHTHSTFSDGSCTPEQLVREARDAGLRAIALTDHDCTGGLDRFLEACGRSDIVGVPGVEISADVPRGTLHMLGYFLDWRNEALGGVLERIRDGREIRNRAILRKLNDLGLGLAWDEVAAYAEEDVVGRPHFAQALMAKGLVPSKEAAFDRYLAKGKPAYVDRFRLSAADSIAVIRSAGGLAMLSHPFTLELGRDALRAYVATLAEAGLDGIEAYYSEHTPEQTGQYLELAAELGLAVTGGSDFHGDLNPAVRLGCGFGSLSVPDELLGELQRRAAERALSRGVGAGLCRSPASRLGRRHGDPPHLGAESPNR